jgi:hypothetical protein
MNKKVLIGGIIGSLVVILLIWALIAGIGFLWKQLPEWIAGGERIVEEVIKKAEEVLPGAKERAKEVIPGVAEKVKEIIPGDKIPAEDVPGEDIKQVPRYTDMVRVSYAIDNQRRTVVYRGRVEFRAVSDFYQKEIVAAGFKKRVLSASPEKEVYEYIKGRQRLEFSFKKIPTIHSEISELTIKEL